MTMAMSELDKERLCTNQVRNSQELNEGSNVQREKS